ncbi:hypothetical protein B0H14DRAFT_2531904 [Mycena olivaceomarginata]|nr:hypothetical protein B0H14DRAFT_2531904 [Mycena olivaceomarginata]
MSRASVLLVLFFCIALAFASPVQRGNATVEALDKRITHVGRVRVASFIFKSNCGYWDSDSSPVVAISKARYDANGGENCNQASRTPAFTRIIWIQITNTANGKTAYGKTRDSCAILATPLRWICPPALFKEISTLATGEITISWHFMAAGWSPMIVHSLTTSLESPCSLCHSRNEIFRRPRRCA